MPLKHALLPENLQIQDDGDSGPIMKVDKKAFVLNHRYLRYSNGHFVQVEIRGYCTFPLMEKLWIRKVSHKERVGSLVEAEWVSAVLRQPINQPFEHLSPPLPVSALRSTAAARSPQEATG